MGRVLGSDTRVRQQRSTFRLIRLHKANIVLGRLALSDGDVKEAEFRLLEAGRTPGSPQLNSFGPNMQLAHELLSLGRRDAVRSYFQLCAAFWDMGAQQLGEWTSIVDDGGIPDFGANLDY